MPLPPWVVPYGAKIGDMVGRLRADEVLVVRRALRNARLAEELTPGGVVVELAAYALEQLEESLRRDVEAVQRGRPHGTLAIVLRDVDGRGQVAVYQDGGR